MIKIRRLPTILALLVLVIGMAAGIYLVSQGSTWFLQAEPETIPKQMKITNITDGGFTVSWVTDSQTLGLVKYGREQDFSFTAVDDRDQNSGINRKYFTHHITIRSLEPKTNYFFKLGSEGKIFDNNGQSYPVTTGTQIQESPPASDIAYGAVVKNDGSPAADAIIYFSLPDTVPQSTFTKDSGEWTIPLNQARSVSLNGYATYDKNSSIEEFFVQAGLQETSTVIATTDIDSPLPQITLGQNFDFRNSSSEITSQNTTTLPTSKFTFEELPPPTEATGEVSIINPNEKEIVNTAKPAILGTAPPGESLTITIESTKPIIETIRVDQSGNWEWSPTENLKPGVHKITVSYSDKQGLLHAISRNFTVLAASSSDLPAIESTPSATATPYLTPTLSPTPSPTATPTGRPSLPSTESGVPQPGNLTPTFFLFIIGLGLIVIGIVSLV